ncbi:DHA2 family efflux MFS transporter permease subunit [Actinomadura sp. NPDC047616]|uniref:MFS transporter n=1 Tax=Actinomadura sp. NPDC047616 TaxID=3155914 RepID=UPI0033FECB3E
MTRGRYRWALAVVAVSAFMITMDNTVVANALPTIMADLDMSTSAKDWVATGYILMFSCLMIAGGRLTDVYGCRVTFVSGMTVFTAASAACGLAPDATLLILARVAQGAGAALALPATQVMVTVGRTDKQRSLGMIVWVGAGSTATALGPTIGGLIVQHWHWGWIFLINIVPGVLVILLGLVVLTGHGENADARVDLPGVLISATMLFAFTYGLEEGRTRGWTDPSVLSVFALVLIALVCFVAVESWAPDPMIDLRFFRNRVFTGGLLSQMLYGIGFNGMIFYSATFLQRYLGFTPPEAGLVMLPPSIAIMVLTPVGFWLAAKIGPRGAIGGGMALMAFGMFLFSTLRRGDGYAELMPGVMIVGAGAALGMPLVMYVLKAVPEHQAGVASGIINVIREASGAFGIAIVGLLVHEVPEAGASAESLETFRDGTASGLIVGAAAVLIGGLICGLTLPSKRGWLGPKHGKHSTPPETTPTPEPALTAPIPTTQNPLPRHATPPDGALPQDALTRRKVTPSEAVHPPDAPRPRNAAPPTEVVPPDDVSARGAIPRDAGPPHDALPPRGAVRARDALPPSGPRPRWEALPPDDVLPSRSAVPFDNAELPPDVPQPRDAVPARSDVVATGEVGRRSPFPPPPEGWYHPYVPEDDTDPWGEWEVPRRGDAW